MLQSMKHRGPDSTGYALYGPPSQTVVMRYKLADANDARDFEFAERLERHRDEVEHGWPRSGAMVDVRHGDRSTPTGPRFRYNGDLKPLADYIEDVPGVRGAVAGPLARDRQGPQRRGDAWPSSTSWTGSPAPTRSATCGWRPSPTSTSPAPTPTGPTRSPTSPSCTTASSPTTSSGGAGSSARGHRFQSECDSEIIAVYLAEKMGEGLSLESRDDARAWTSWTASSPTSA